MKSQKFFAALLAGALTLGVVPFTQFNADINAGPSIIISPDKNEKLDLKEDLRPAESYSEPIVQYDDKIYETEEMLEKDKQELQEGLQKGYISVPDNPNEPLEAMTQEEVQTMIEQQDGASVQMYDGEIPNEGSANPDATQSGDSQASANPDVAQQSNPDMTQQSNPEQQQVQNENSANPDTAQQPNPDATQQAQDPRANDNAGKSHIINITPYNGGEYFGFISFRAKGTSTKKVHLTSYKTLKGSRDTNKTIYCLQMNKDNPPDGTKMEFMAKESSELLYLIRLGHPRGDNMGNKLVPQEVKNCFYKSSDGKNHTFWNYYITQAAIWAQVGDTTLANIKNGKPANGAPAGIQNKVAAFHAAAQKHGEEWAAPKIWVNKKKVEAVLDKDPSQYSTPAYELDVPGAEDTKDCLKLMEKNVYTDANDGTEKPPAMEMTFPDGAPKGLRVLVRDKRENKDRVYEVDSGKPPLLYAQDQYRFILPKPTKAGSFKYKISGPYWTWRAYRYKAGSYQQMLKEDVVKFGEKLNTEGEIFWKVPDIPPTQTDEYVVQAKKVDEKTGKALPGAEFELTYPNGRSYKAITGEDGIAKWPPIPETQLGNGKFTVTETKAPEGYILPPNASQVVTLPPESGTTVTVTFKDQPKLPDSFPIKVVKKDSADKKPLRGAEFTLTKPDGNKETGVSSAEGTVIFDNLTLTGKYIIEETKAPEGYELAKNPKQEVEVKDAKNPPTAAFEFLNDKIPDKGRVELLKTDAVTNKPLEGVEFALYKKAGSAKPDENQKPDDSTKPGEEAQKPEGEQQQSGDNQKPDDSAKPEPPKDTKANETQKPGGDSAKPGGDSAKPDDSTKPGDETQKPGDETQKPGEETQKPGDNQKPDDTQQNGEDVLVGNFTTNAEGKIVVENLDPGDYYFVETKGLEGYIVDKEKLEFTIPGEGGTIQLTKHNKPKDSSVEITKTDVSTGEVLAGAKIKIYAENKTTVLHEGVTDSSGKFAFGPLKPGKYYYQESGAPAGYILDDKLYEFEVKDNGEIVKCTLTNKPEEKPTPSVEKPIKGKLEITKVDISDGKLLPNAHFAIYDENKNQIMKGVTDSNGIATFELGAGKYFYQEYDAPIGYQLDDTLFPFEIKTDGEIVKCRMTNVPKPVPLLPTTGSAIATSGGLIAAVGAIASVLFKRWM